MKGTKRLDLIVVLMANTLELKILLAVTVEAKMLDVWSVEAKASGVTRVVLKNPVPWTVADPRTATFDPNPAAP